MKNTKAILDEIGVKCPLCKGNIVRRRSKKGRMFYGCSNFPDCNFVSWDEPVEEKCPECESLMVKKNTKKENSVRCTNKECGYSKIEKK